MRVRLSLVGKIVVRVGCCHVELELKDDPWSKGLGKWFRSIYNPPTEFIYGSFRKSVKEVFQLLIKDELIDKAPDVSDAALEARCWPIQLSTDLVTLCVDDVRAGSSCPFCEAK